MNANERLLRTAEDAGICTLRQFRVFLSVGHSRKPVNAREIADALGLGQPMVSSIVANMVHGGLVAMEKRRNTGQGLQCQMLHARLTAKGRELFARMGGREDGEQTSPLLEGRVA